MADHEHDKDVGGSNNDKEVIKEALERFEESQDATDFNRTAAHEDILFARLGKQWPDKVKKLREEEDRPCLTVNKLPSFVRQVINDSRQNKPGIIVHPVDNGADIETADVINGLVRSIERNSNADVAYDTAIDNAVSGGFGFFTIGIDFAHDDTFDMECRIHRVADPLSVHWDPNSTEFDASDWDYAFVSDVIKKDVFEQRYPDAAPVDFEDPNHISFHKDLDPDQVRVAEYWLKEEIERKIFLLSNGKTIREEQFTEEFQAIFALQGIKVLKEREVRAHKVTRRLITGVEVLEETPWPGELIPVCPVWGEEVILGSRRYFRSMIQDAKDPQMMFNFWRSATTELVALAPKAPFIVEEGAIPKGQEGKKWATANNRSHAFLSYAKGSQIPQRQPFAGVPAGALQEALNASDDMKAVMGVFDAALGARSNETSGKAILARQRESDVSNFHFIDNLSRAIQYAGRILVDIIPSVYNARETIRIVGLDEKEKVIRLVSGELQPDKQSGKERLYDLNVGKYDVTVKAGPSFSTQREETREALIEIMRSVPGAGPVIGDIVLEHMDFPNAEKVAKRLKRLLPPEIQKAEAQDEAGETEIPPEAQAMIEQGQQQIEQLTAQMQELQQVAEGKQIEAGKLEIDRGKLQLDAAKLQGDQEEMRLQRLAEPPKNFEEDMEQIAAVIAALTQSIAEATAATQQQLNLIAVGQTQLAQALVAPKQVIRDETGRAIGVETVTDLEPVQ